MKTIGFVLTFILIFVNGYTQKPPLKYGKPAENDLSITEYRGACAVILCDYGEYYFDGKLGRVYFYFKHHVRIKILTEEGLKYATQTIPYYDLTKATYYPNSIGYELRAQTINIGANGKISKTKLKPKKNIFNSNIYNDFNTEVTLVFPNVKVGSIIEYEINIPTINIVNPAIWYFQHEIPVIHSELRIIAPEDFDYSAKLYNSEFLDVSDTKSINTSISYSRGSLSYMANRLQFIKSDVPALSNEGPGARIYIKCMLEFASRKFALPYMEELFKAIDPDFKYLDKAEKTNTLANPGFVIYSKPELEKLPKVLMKNPGFGPPLVINMGLTDTIKKLTVNCKSSEEKTLTIYNYVSNQMEWNGLYRVFVNMGFPVKVEEIISRFSGTDLSMNTSLSRPFRKQSGTSSEINFILINLLNSAGLKASPVLVSTSDFDVLDTSFFNLHQFNHVVAYVELEGKNILLDAVRNTEGTILSTVPMNEAGLLIKKNEAEWIRVTE